MKIAIASSGLGHVARGIETWACDTAGALAEVRSQKSEVRAEVRGQRAEGNREGSLSLEVTLFSGAHLTNLAVRFPLLAVHVIPCLKRGDRMARWLSRITPGFAWRWGLKNPYGWEQLSFWWRLWPALRREGIDLLHVQDPMVAYWCRLFRKWGLVKAKEILAHGTEETVEFLSGFDYLQHLAPWHLEQMAGGRRSEVGGRRGEKGFNHEGHEDHRECRGKYWVAMPNFVDCGVFCPDAGRRQAVRSDLGIPDYALVVGCVAAVKKHHKRIDYLIREFAKCSHGQQNAFAARSAPPALKSEDKGSENGVAVRVPFLLIVGAKTEDTWELIQLAESLIPGRYKVLTDCGRDRMPDVYRAMDVFVLTSLFEMMPIALLEALASGVPCLVNKHPVLEWMVGVGEIKDHRLQTTDHRPRAEIGGWGTGGGAAIDMGREGALAEALGSVSEEWVGITGRQARVRAEGVFSKEAVVKQYIRYYQAVMES